MTNEFSDIMSQVFAYAEDLRSFIDDHALPEEWFGEPDHLAYKCRDAAHFDKVLQETQPDAESLSYVELDGRRLGSAELVRPVYIETFGHVQWFEIMQPRPEKEGSDTVGLDHVEFYWPALEDAEAVLSDRGITYHLQANDHMQWISVEINEMGQELKLSGRRLADIVRESIDEDEATVL